MRLLYLILRMKHINLVLLIKMKKLQDQHLNSKFVQYMMVVCVEMRYIRAHISLVYQKLDKFRKIMQLVMD